MKKTWPVLLGLLLSAVPATVQAQFAYAPNCLRDRLLTVLEKKGG